MKVIGLTGSIGMGKTTVTKQLEAFGAKICHADALVHQLLGKGGEAVRFVEMVFDDVVENGAVNRRKLGEIVFKDKEKLAGLESILHPLVVAMEDEFVARERRLGAPYAVLDIPLLFETGAEARCDFTITVTAPAFIQRQRVLRRMHMSEQKFKAVLASQLPDREKQRRATYIVQTGLGKAYSFAQLKDILSCAK